jgi:hypothetical protein
MFGFALGVTCSLTTSDVMDVCVLRLCLVLGAGQRGFVYKLKMAAVLVLLSSADVIKLYML